MQEVIHFCILYYKHTFREVKTIFEIKIKLPLIFHTPSYLVVTFSLQSPILNTLSLRRGVLNFGP